MPIKKDTKIIKKDKAVKKVAHITPAPAQEEDPSPPSMSLHGELFWEYRAKVAEYEKILLERSIALNDLKLELSDPKYKKIVDLMQKDEDVRTQLKEYANFLRGVQIKVATHLGLSIEVFLKECFIDHETGVVRILD